MPSVEQVEQSMQVELTTKDESLQTSPREEDNKLPEQHIETIDIVPQVADKLVTDIIETMPIKVPTDSQKTLTETVTTVEQVTQTTPRSETVQVSQPNEPYEINIETSFVIPDDATAAQQISGAPVVLEIQKSYVIDDTQPGNVREIESTIKEKGKKSKSKKKKKNKDGKHADLDDDAADNKQIALAEEPKDIVVTAQTGQQPAGESSGKPTVVTINITKTTVFEKSNIVGREARNVQIEEISSDDKGNIYHFLFMFHFVKL